jgi:uncharacterized membrane protein SpoIIM required for sporulation
MREVQFIKQNRQRWEAFEQQMVQGIQTNPDKLADLFIQLTDDLSYSRTNYPESKTTLYLNNLTAKVHQTIYRNKKEKGNRFIEFWVRELPLLVYAERKPLLYALIVFLLTAAVGVVSTAYDETFPRLILGDGYVDMTIENIKRGDPMAVYKDSPEMEMFLRIPFHNIRIAFLIFIAGLFTSLGTGFFLLVNGVMVGAFQYFFYSYGLLATSALTIWIHGTLEISCIVLSGGAGMVMGNSLLFPGTFSRLESFKRGAANGLKTCVGIVPILMLAGFLESFITRLTDMPTWGKLLIIGVSAAFILGYFVLYPFLLHRKISYAGPENRTT